jgi:hypothetical protein
MTKPRKITRAAAGGAKIKLEQFCAKIDEYDALGRDEPSDRQPWKGRDPDRKAEAEKAQSAISDWLHQQAQDVARLLRDVHVQGFYEHSPEAGRASVQRAIGEYARIETGGAPSPPPLMIPPAAPSEKPRWWVTVLIAMAGSGAITATVNAVWGQAVRCEPNQEFLCPPLNGVQYAQRCNDKGLGRTLCIPLSELRQLNATPPASLPTTTSPRPLPDGGTTP